MTFLSGCVVVKAKTEAEIHEARKIINPLLDTEKGFAKVRHTGQSYVTLSVTFVSLCDNKCEAQGSFV